MRSLVSLAVVLLIGASCTNQSLLEPPKPITKSEKRISLFAASDTIDDGWRHLPLRGKTEYKLDLYEGRLSIRARGRNSASGLIRRVEIDPYRCHDIEWTWRATKIQKQADLARKDREDVAASIFILFGDPGFLSSPSKVDTLRYVWTNDRHKTESIVDNPYLPGVVQSIVIRSGEFAEHGWAYERRNLLRDFEIAFGRKPKSPIEAIAIFTDNDQTKEPVEAHYAEGTVTCRL